MVCCLRKLLDEHIVHTLQACVRLGTVEDCDVLQRCLLCQKTSPSQSCNNPDLVEPVRLAVAEGLGLSDAYRKHHVQKIFRVVEIVLWVDQRLSCTLGFLKPIIFKLPSRSLTGMACLPMPVLHR